MTCLQGDIGPFNASLPTEVPLWVAIFLKQRRKCRIQPPDWMDVGKITHSIVVQFFDDRHIVLSQLPVSCSEKLFLQEHEKWWPSLSGVHVCLILRET